MIVRYEVAIDLEPALAERFAAYMQAKHIPEILATGCFSQIDFERAGPARFRTSYIAASQADLDRYLRDHTAHFRADFLAHFPSGASSERAVWTVLQSWGGQPGAAG